MISKILIFVGIAALALYGFFTAQAYFHQAALEEELYQPLKQKSRWPAPPAENI